MPRSDTYRYRIFNDVKQRLPYITLQKDVTFRDVMFAKYQ